MTTFEDGPVVGDTHYSMPNGASLRPRAGADARMTESIAVVGVSCRMPGADGLPAFADLLFAGRDPVSEIPDERWTKARFLHPVAGPARKDLYLRRRLPRSHRWLRRRLSSASRRARRSASTRSSGSCWNSPTRRSRMPGSAPRRSPARRSASSSAARPGISRPARSPMPRRWTSMPCRARRCPRCPTGSPICSACAGRASRSIPPARRRWWRCIWPARRFAAARSALALAGGVNLLLTPQSFVGFARASMLSRRGRCHPFDARADGYVRAEGGGAVVLKPLAAALADGDDIRAVIRATGVNSDGRTNGFSLPSGDAQAALLRRRLRPRPASTRTTCAISRRTAPARRSATRSRRTRSARPWRGAARARPADRLGEVQYRPSGAGQRHGGADEADPRLRARRGAGVAAFRAAEPQHCLRRAEPGGGGRTAGACGRGPGRRAGGHQFVRLRRHQRARRAGGAAAPSRAAGGCRPGRAAAGFRPLRRGAARAGRRLARPAVAGRAGRGCRRCCAAPRGGATTTPTGWRWYRRGRPSWRPGWTRGWSATGRSGWRSVRRWPATWPLCSRAMAANGPAWRATRWRSAPPSAPRSPRSTPGWPRRLGWSVADRLGQRRAGGHAAPHFGGAAAAVRRAGGQRSARCGRRACGRRRMSATAPARWPRPGQAAR